MDTSHLVIITPDGRNSWYVNSITDTLDRYEDALIHDLLPIVIHRFHIDSTKTGVAGFSMGGYGALSLGLRHPDAFRFVGALSASLDLPLGIPDLERNGRGGLRASIEHAMGTDPLAWSAFDLRERLQTLDSASAPYLYLVTGIQDEFLLRLSLYRSFAESVRERGITYEFHESPGRHTWAFCEQEIGSLIRRFLSIVDAR
jgi:S-formylglutathione hydrolase FrmB